MSEPLKMTPDTASIIAELVREMRKPDPAVEAAKAAKFAQEQAQIASFVAEHEASAADLKRRQDMCDHRKPSGETAIHHGQIFTGGYMVPRCVRCGKEFAKVSPPREYVTGTGF